MSEPRWPRCWPSGRPAAWTASALPEHPDVALQHQLHSRNAPDIGEALAVLRTGAGEALLVGEAYVPAAQLGPYVEHLDVAFAFELLHAPWDAGAVRGAIERALDPAGAAGRVAWVLSNHDFPRLPDRVGRANTRAAALLCLTLPGPVFVYQGDEIGMADGPGREPPDDRAGRDRHRHPMRWSDDEPHGGFTTGEPWLPSIPVDGGAIAAQCEDPDSVLALYSDLIAARRELGGALEFDDAPAGVLAYRRGAGHAVALNMGSEPAGNPFAGASVVRATSALVAAPGAPAPVELAPGEGVLARI
jgi:alpha-glucosidase